MACRMGQEAEGKADGSGDMTGAAALEQDPALAKANSVKCAKEKNRQAQRRFRERQKGLIQALKERADSLQKQVGHPLIPLSLSLVPVRKLVYWSTTRCTVCSVDQ